MKSAPFILNIPCFTVTFGYKSMKLLYIYSQDSTNMPKPICQTKKGLIHLPEQLSCKPCSNSPADNIYLPRVSR